MLLELKKQVHRVKGATYLFFALDIVASEFEKVWMRVRCPVTCLVQEVIELFLILLAELLEELFSWHE